MHGSVSALLDQAGAVEATYAYDAYGESDPLVSSGDTDPLLHLNSYRYTGKRTDPGSGTIDMGARRFAPDTARFLQPDVYGGALSNLGLSMDPLTGNRYSLAAGNPVSFVEADGHRLNDAGAGGGTASGPDPGDEPPAGRFVNPSAWDEAIEDTEEGNLGEPLPPQCYGTRPITEDAARELAPQCLMGGANMEAEMEKLYLEATGVPYSEGYEPPSEFERILAGFIPIPGITGGKLLAGAARGAVSAGRRIFSFIGRGLRSERTISAARILGRLPAYTGGKTQGILQAGSKEVDLVSGWSGPASQLPRGTSGFDIVTKSHVEGPRPRSCDSRV